MQNLTRLQNSRTDITWPKSIMQEKFIFREWGPCALRHGIQNSMEAIFPYHPALSTKWLDWVAKWCERWRMRTGLINQQGSTVCTVSMELFNLTNKEPFSNKGSQTAAAKANEPTMFTTKQKTNKDKKKSRFDTWKNISEIFVNSITQAVGAKFHSSKPEHSRQG